MHSNRKEPSTLSDVNNLAHERRAGLSHPWVAAKDAENKQCRINKLIQERLSNRKRAKRGGGGDWLVMALLSTKTYQFIYLIFGSNLGKKNNNKTTFFFCHHSFCHHHYWCSFASFTGGGGRNRGTRSVEQQSSTCTISQHGHGDHSHVAGQNTVLSV